MICLRPFFILPAAALLSVCQSVSASPNTACVHAELPCAATERFSVLSENATELESKLLHEVTESAARDFQMKFGAMPSPTIIVPTGTINADVQSRLTANGYMTIMPWISPAERVELRNRDVIRKVEEQLGDRPQVVKDAAIASALAQLQSQTAAKTPATKEDFTDLSALSHELGHKWFVDRYPSEDTEQTEHAYGGWAPDWLDESAAIAMESEDGKQRRRVKFSEIEPEKRIPLAEFLTMVHPAAQAGRDLAERLRMTQLPQTEGSETKRKLIRRDVAELPDATERTQSPRTEVSKTTSRVIRLSGQEAEDFIAQSGGDRAPNFYAQALVFSDYLEDRSGTDKILSQIAAPLAEGKSFTTWLSSNTVGLPKNMDALDLDWLEYISRL